MPIPLNIQYKQAVSQASNFDKLNPIEPVKEGGDIKAAAGGFAIVFKMYKPDEGKYYALKCFTAPVAHRNERIHAIHQYLSNITSPHFAQFKYLPTELWVNTTPTEGAEYPVVLMEWIEGQTLGEAIQAACQQRNTNRLKQLLIQFIDLAMILLAMPCAHGDLKHDNIIVSNTGHLVLVDYDGMFVPVLQGQEANEIGGQDYQHQSRTGSTFDRHIDDFSIAIICLSIGALIHQPALYAQYNHGQNLLLRRRDWQHQALSQCELLRGLHTPALQPLIQYIEQTANYRLPLLFNYLLDLREAPTSPTDLSQWWLMLSIVEKVLISANYALLKAATDLDFKKHVADQYEEHFKKGIEYSISNMDVPPIDLVKTLVAANFMGNDKYPQLTNLEFIRPLVNLQKLSCSCNGIGSLEPLEGLNNLKVLFCSTDVTYSNNNITTCISSLEPLRNLTNLQILDCSGNMINSLEPLIGLVNLRTLICRGDSDLHELIGISVVISIDNLTPLQSLTNLEILDVSYNQISNLKPLRNLTKLEKLGCSDNQISSLEPLQKLTKLQLLYCGSNQISSLEPLRNLTKLQTLYCGSYTIFSTSSSNQISSLEPLRNLTNLQDLNCESNKINTLEPLRNLTKLHTLGCSDNQISSLEPLRNLTNLQTINCSANQISSLEPLRRLTNLRKLYYSSGLMSFNKKSNPISDTEAANLKRYLPNCNIT